MPKKKDEPLSWFRVYYSSRYTIKKAESAKIGDALKAALEYFTETRPAAAPNEIIADKIAANLDEPTTAIFWLFVAGVNDSYDKHRAQRESGSRGGKTTAEKNKQAQSEQTGPEPDPAQVAALTEQYKEMTLDPQPEDDDDMPF